MYNKKHYTKKYMEIENELNNNVENKKSNFLGDIIKGTINNAIDIGLKTILPDLIEDQVIDVKDALIKNGLKAGIDTAVDSAIELGKSAIGIFTGNFENMKQVKTAIAEGGIVDTVSTIIDKVLNKAYLSGRINNSVNKAIKTGKNILIDNIIGNINNEIEQQNYSIEKLGNYVENWKEFYNNKDFENMEKEYKKIIKQLKNAIPIENILKETRQIEVLHNLIKNNGKNFELTEDEKKLVNNLSI